jgi:hypothetical protein
MALSPIGGIYPVLSYCYGLLTEVPADYRPALTEAWGFPSPVDQTVKSMEIFYAIMKSGEVSGSQLADMAAATYQLSYVVMSGSFHGKGERAMNLIGASLRALSDPNAPTGQDQDVEFVLNPPAPNPATFPQ